MKHIIYFILFAGLCCFISCDDQFDNVRKYSGEVIYPACFDTIIGQIGFERVELDLMKVGRVPSSELTLGKATKTVIEYDGERHYIDSVCSWVNVTGLTESKLYRFYVYTEDDFGNHSVPQEIALIPFTQLDKDLINIFSPKLTISPTAFIAEWPTGLNSIAYEYFGLEFSFTDKDGAKQTGSTEGSRFYCGNLEADQKVQINIDYTVLPIVEGVKILDTLTVTRTMEIEMPNATTPFAPTEIAALRANGISAFNSQVASTVTSLILPMHIGTFSDLFYFSNLQELDLTGAGLKNVLPEMSLAGNGVTYNFGGGDYQPYMQRIEYTKIFQVNPPIASQQTLLDLLESGTLKKIKYIQNSMSIDDILEPYIANGVVELITEDWYPDEAPLDPMLVHSGRIVTTDFDVEFRYGIPISEVPHPETLNEPDKVYYVAPIGRNATVAWTLAKQYMYDFERYRYLKFKIYMYCENEADVLNNAAYWHYRKLWPRIRYSMWGPDQGNNPFGAGDDWEWKPGGNRDQYLIPEASINNGWHEFTIDMKQVTDKIMAQNHGSPYNNPASGHYHSRNICFNFGGEQGPNPYNPTGKICYYFTDVRLCKDE